MCAHTLTARRLALHLHVHRYELANSSNPARSSEYITDAPVAAMSIIKQSPNFSDLTIPRIFQSSLISSSAEDVLLNCLSRLHFPLICTIRAKCICALCVHSVAARHIPHVRGCTPGVASIERTGRSAQNNRIRPEEALRAIDALHPARGPSRQPLSPPHSPHIVATGPLSVMLPSKAEEASPPTRWPSLPLRPSLPLTHAPCRHPPS